MRVHWPDTAEGHLDAIYAYIAQDSSEYAKRTVDRLTIITIRMLHQEIRKLRQEQMKNVLSLS